MIERIRLKNITTQSEIIMDKLMTKYILSKVDLGQIKANHNTYQYIDRTGVFISGTSLSYRDIMIEGYIVGSDELEMKQLMKNLNAFVNPMHYFYLYYNGYKIDMMCYNTIKYGKSYQENNEVYCKFYIDAIAPKGTFTKEDENNISGADITPEFHFPLFFNETQNNVIFGIRNENLIFELINDGDLDVGCQLIFECLNGDISNPYLVNINTQEKIELNKTLTIGERVVINTNPGMLSVTGIKSNEELDYFKYWKRDNVWIKILKGNNIFRYGAQSGEQQLKVELNFNPEWLEVETNV